MVGNLLKCPFTPFLSRRCRFLSMGYKGRKKTKRMRMVFFMGTESKGFESSCLSAKSVLLTSILQLDAILTGAKTVNTVPAKKNGNQKGFEKMLIMHYRCPGIGTVKMTVGVKRRMHEKIQYCITALEA